MMLYTLIIGWLSAAMVTAFKHSSSSPRVSLKISLSGHQFAPESYTLTCEPLGGDHPEPRKACDTLNIIGGDLDSYHKIPFPCRDTTLPAVQVDVMGTYYDRPIQFSKKHANYKCSRAVMDGFYP